MVGITGYRLPIPFTQTVRFAASPQLTTSLRADGRLFFVLYFTTKSLPGRV